MHLSLNLNLPSALVPHSQAIANTIKPYLKIKISPNSTQWWHSKFGGLPYLPKNVNYPRNNQGKYLQFLAPINFSEIPPLEHFPSEGILQFYVDGNDVFYGISHDDYNYNSCTTNQEGFRVLYFGETEQKKEGLVTDFDLLLKDEKNTSSFITSRISIIRLSSQFITHIVPNCHGFFR